MIYLGPTVYWDDWDESWPFPMAAQLFVLPWHEDELVTIARELGLKKGAHRPSYVIPHWLLSVQEAEELKRAGHKKLRLVSGAGVVHAAQVWRRHRASLVIKKPKSTRRD